MCAPLIIIDLSDAGKEIWRTWRLMATLWSLFTLHCSIRGVGSIPKAMTCCMLIKRSFDQVAWRSETICIKYCFNKPICRRKTEKLRFPLFTHLYYPVLSIHLTE